MSNDLPLTKCFHDISLDDLTAVGGKNASLGELTQRLKQRTIKVPAGFAVTTTAFHLFIEKGGFQEKIASLLDRLDKSDLKSFAAIGKTIRDLVLATPIPEEVAAAIKAAYLELAKDDGKNISVAVRSSATAEDLPGLSFAGQHDSFLFIKGSDDLIDACRRCYASLYNDRALSYRIDNNIEHLSVSMSVGVQKMVRSDSASSGVIFTLDPETGLRQTVLISAVYGTGEAIVQGLVEPDEYYVHKPTFNSGHRCVYRHKLGRKHLRMVADASDPSRPVSTLEVPPPIQRTFCLSDPEITLLADAAISIERHYSEHHGHDTPMDIEWAKSGDDHALYILQARPETVHAISTSLEAVTYSVEGSGRVLATGRAVGKKAANGTARRLENISDIGAFQSGDILVAETTSPDWEPVMKRAAAIVTDHGGRTCHSAIVARELGIPAIVGTGNGTSRVADGAKITVTCAAGETGQVLEGLHTITATKTDVSTLKRPRTKMMVNIANPEQASQVSLLQSDGVGLTRLEFVIANIIRAHPMALLHMDDIGDSEIRDQLEELIKPYNSGKSFFIETLAEGIASIAAAFYPNPVIVRMSDFKSNEYEALIGGCFYEHREENPMIGFRGAARYVHPDYADAFSLECAAFKKARETMGFHNMKLMVPFCRTMTEAETVLEAMARNGLERGDHGLEVYMMCEIPSNVLSIDSFSGLFDGFSIGSNDLTQLVLGIDRDSSRLSGSFDERDPAVVKAITMAIDGAHRNDKPIGICGQAPSDYPDFTKLLVEKGIDSISVTPDSFFETLQTTKEAEEASILKQ